MFAWCPPPSSEVLLSRANSAEFVCNLFFLFAGRWGRYPFQVLASVIFASECTGECFSYFLLEVLEMMFLKFHRIHLKNIFFSLENTLTY